MEIGSGQLHNDIVKVIKCNILRKTEYLDRMEEIRNTFNILSGRPSERSSLGTSRLIVRWEGIIIIDLKEVDANSGNWIMLRIGVIREIL